MKRLRLYQQSPRGDCESHTKPQKVGSNGWLDLYMGALRPGFREDAPSWFTRWVFLFFAALILAAIFLI